MRIYCRQLRVTAHQSNLLKVTKGGSFLERRETSFYYLNSLDCLISV